MEMDEFVTDPRRFNAKPDRRPLLGMMAHSLDHGLEEGITLFVCGDVMTGRGIDQVLEHPGDPWLREPWMRSALDYVRLADEKHGRLPRRVDAAYIWGDALAILDEAAPDARNLNLETAVTDRGQPWPGKGIQYRMHPDNVGCLTVARIDCCVLANNHVLDWSYEGLEQSIRVLEDAGIAVAGAGRDAATAQRPALIELEAGSRVIVVALGTASSGVPEAWAAGDGRPGVAMARELSHVEVEVVADRIASVLRPGDLVIASIHWGPNWGYPIPTSHRRFARALIDHAGVHVVHGHSSHHPLGIEVYKERPILYGCGDLINDYEGIRGHEEFRAELGLLYLVTMTPASGVLRRLELIPVRRRRFRLRAASTEETAWLEAILARESRRLGTTVATTGRGRLLVLW